MEYVTSAAALQAVAERIDSAEVVAVDTEAAGYHRYFDRVCLIQLSTRSETFVIDTLAVRCVAALGPVLERASTEVVFHDADYDLRLLDRDFGLRVHGLFDTKIAAQFLGEPGIGLASLTKKYLGLHMEKAFQRADWAQRPLPSAMLEYAAEDTRHLLPLRDRLREALIERGRLAWAEEEFLLHEATRWTAPAEDPDAYLRLKGTRDLKPRQLAALRELYAWREDEARSRDVAPFRILSNEGLVELARRMPETLGALSTVPGVGRSLASRHGSALLGALARARALPSDRLPTRPRGKGRPAPDPEFEAALERLRIARDEAAQDLGLDRGFLMPRSQLEEIARRRPTSLEALAEVPEMRRWQIDALGTRLLAAISG